MTESLSSSIERRFGTPAHALVLASAFSIFSWRLTTWLGSAAGIAGSIAGVLAAAWLVRARVRLPAILLLGVAMIPASLLASMAVQSELGSSLLGAELALVVDDGVHWFFLAVGSCGLLRALALRYRAALAIEGVVVVAAVAATVAAHRDGMIARPLEVADWFWTQGLDPVVAFLAVGLVGATLFAAILAHGRTRARTILQLLLVLVLGALVAARIHSHDQGPAREQLASDGKQKPKESFAKDDGTKGGLPKPSAGQSSKSFEKDLPSSGSGKSRPAAIVVFHREVAPLSGVFYFRHGAFSQFNGERLVEATEPSVDPDGRFDFPTQKTEITRPPESEVRTLVAMDVAMLTPHTRPFGLIDPVELEPMPNPEPARFKRAYRVVSSVVTSPYEEFVGRSAGDPSWDDQLWRHYTEAPKDPRYRALADQLAEKLRPEFKKDPLAIAMVVKKYLEENTTYSLKRRYEGSSDPTAEFLFGDRRGYCVHTSHSAAYLMRTLGVPARVSAGYAVPASNLGGGSSLLLKSSDAHAWAEIFLEGVGWLPIEVTPLKTDFDPPKFAEQDLQQMLGEMARKEGRVQQSRSTGPRLGDLLAAVWSAIPWVLLGLLTAAYATKLWRLWLPTFAGPRALPRVAYRAALDRLASVGVVRQVGESREKFRARTKGLSPSFAELTDVHLRAAFGRSGAVESPGLARSAGQVAKELRARVPWWRRLTGALNPVSWMLSK